METSTLNKLVSRKAYELHRRASKVIGMELDRPIKAYVTTGMRGHADLDCPGERAIYIPVWAINEEQYRPGYMAWYIAHELAHHYADFLYNDSTHGKAFMLCLKLLCPAKSLGYEEEYNTRNYRRHVLA